MDCKSPHWPGGNPLPRGTKLKFGDSKPSEDGHHHHLQDCHHGLLQLRLERWQKQRKQTGGRGRRGGGGSGGGGLGVKVETRGSFLQKINTFSGSNAVLRFCVLVSVYTRSFMAAMLIKQLMCFNKQQTLSILMVEKKPFCVKDPPPSILIFEDYLVFAS